MRFIDASEFWDFLCLTKQKNKNRDWQMFSSVGRFLNWSWLNLATVFKQGRGYLLLVMFFVVLLFFILVTYSVFGIKNGGGMFLMAMLVLVAGGLITSYGFRKTTKKGSVILASIVLFIGVITLAPPRGFIGFSLHQIDRARFYLVQEEYLSKVKKVARTNEPRFMWFSWGTGDDLVFDESDELSYPNRAKPEGWWRRAGKESGFGKCEWQAEMVAQHFYVVKFAC